MKIGDFSLAAALLVSSAEAIGSKPPPNNIKPHLVDGFIWADPFPQAKESYHPTCEAVEHFWGLEYTLHELMEEPPLGLKPWANGLKKHFQKREYPGGWSGYDRHGYDRSILKMDYTDVPLAVREWIEEQEKTDGQGKGLFGVFRKSEKSDDDIDDIVDMTGEINRAEDKNKVAIFAPGAIYHVLPLWVAEESDCKDKLLDLSNYKPTPADGNVIGWPDHKLPKDHETHFRVTVQVLKEKSSPSMAEGGASAKEEL